MKGIGIGPSWKKLPLDIAFSCRRAAARAKGRTTPSTRTRKAGWWGVIVAGFSACRISTNAFEPAAAAHQTSRTASPVWSPPCSAGSSVLSSGVRAW